MLVSMYVDKVPNRESKPCFLLRESYREGGKVKKRTLANLSHLPEHAIEGLKILLKKGSLVNLPALKDSFEIKRSLPHGHVKAVLEVAKSIGLANIISSKPSEKLQLVMAMIISRIIYPKSKLSTSRGLDTETRNSTLSQELGIEECSSDDLYKAMDWLIKRQSRIEKKLADKHLEDRTLVLYDITSTYFEGDSCPIAKFGYSRDKKRGKKQIVIGLLCAKDGCPVSVEVFEGNLKDHLTVKAQLNKLKERFGISRVVFVGDRGMITNTEIDKEFNKREGFDWITCLGSRSINKLIRKGDFQLSIFDEVDIAEIKSPDYPDERLIVCYNSSLANKRRHTREDLLKATEKELNKIAQATKRNSKRLKGQDEIGLKVGSCKDNHKMSKHFNFTITEDSFSYERNLDSINNEAKTDGIYIVRTSVEKEQMSSNEVVFAYKSLSQVEQAFRSLKTVDLKIRPVYHYSEERVKSHVFLCMLAYYIEWHMRKLLSPVLFDDPYLDQEAVRVVKTMPNWKPGKQRGKAVPVHYMIPINFTLSN